MKLQAPTTRLLLLPILLASAYLSACESPTLAAVKQGQNFVGTAAGAGTEPVVPVKKNYDGLGCQGDDDCESAHCSNHICCSKGECCKVAEDCGIDTKSSVVCEDAPTCQGTRGQAACSTAYRCVIKEGGVPDDSGCDPKTEANDCGLYKSVFCSGMSDQKAPKCPESCMSNDDCDAAAHCADGKCIANLTPGGACGTDTDCATHHCSHGFCCAMGDCCGADTDCDPTVYGGTPTCMDMAMCQGFAKTPACVDSQCTSQMQPNDSACDRNVIANQCGGTPVRCRGGVEQGPPPPCATGTCGGFLTAATCNEEAYCWQGKCVPDQPDGESCPSSDAACQSGHCQNTVCCSEGDCCTSDDQCPSVRMCTDPSKCDGTRQDRHCDVTHGKCENTGAPVKDDTGCMGRPTGLDCGGNFAKACSGAADTPTPMAPADCIPCTRVATCTGPGAPPLGAMTDNLPCNRLCRCSTGCASGTGTTVNGTFVPCSPVTNCFGETAECRSVGQTTTEGAGVTLMRTAGCMGGPTATCVAARCGS